MPKKIIPFLLHFVKKQKWGLLFFFLLQVSLNVNGSLLPYFLKKIVNTLVLFEEDRSHALRALLPYLFSVGGLWTFFECGLRGAGWLSLKLFPVLRSNVRKESFAYAQKHSHSFFTSQLTGSLGNKLADLPMAVERIVEMILMYLFTTITGLIICVFTMSSAHYMFSLIFLGWIIFHIGLKVIFLPKGLQLAAIHSESVSQLNGTIVDSISNFLNVRLFNKYDHEKKLLARYQKEEIKRSEEALKHIEKLKLFQGTGATILFVVNIVLLIKGWREGWLTTGDFSLIVMLTWSYMQSAWWLSFQITLVSREMGKLKNAITTLFNSHEVQDAKGAAPIVVDRGEIAFQNVTFAYPQSAPLFKDLSVTIKGGEKVGLVGLSGAGKSTFVHLILRSYDVQKGTISIDGQDISKVTLESLHQAAALIPQDPSLFHRTLYENLRYSNPESTEEEVMEASRKGQCHDFIVELEQGYHSLVGDRGIKLSGGQRQRVAVARAFLKHVPILILDEATSSLDSITEGEIQSSLTDLMQGKTTIVIAHRLSTLLKLDRILVFSHGKIIEDGTIDELIRNKGHFAALWKKQMGKLDSIAGH